MKHTPGPWFNVSVDHEWTEICDAPAYRNRAIIAVVRPAGNDSVSRGIFTTRNANACIIAAAPELLGALEYIAKRIAAGDSLGDSLVIADCAIAKAKGGR